MLISEWLQTAASELKLKGVEPYNLDSRLILKHITGFNDTAIIAGNYKLSDAEIAKLNLVLQKRLAGQPLAYLLGSAGFFGRKFFVEPGVLIPRAETEGLIENIIALNLPPEPSILDVGTGSGIIGITLALEIEKSEVTISDFSPAALKVASHNVNKFIDQINAKDSKIKMVESDLLGAFASAKFNLIVANLPYVDRAWDWLNLNQLRYEPSEALFADSGGLDLIKKLISSSKNNLVSGGFLVLEMDPCQIAEASEFALNQGFEILEKIEGSLSDFVLILKDKSSN